MKLLFCISIATLFLGNSFAQTPSTGNYVKLSGGSVLFGTGDIPGFGVYIEGSGNLLKLDPYLKKHLQIGA